METSLPSPARKSTLLIFGLVLTLQAVLVESQLTNDRGSYPFDSQRTTPPPSRLSPPPTRQFTPGNAAHRPSHGNERKRWHHHHPPPPPPPVRNKNMNTGKMIGLLFVGIAAVMQIGVVGFLSFKRRQLLKSKERYETCVS